MLNRRSLLGSALAGLGLRFGPGLPATIDVPGSFWTVRASDGAHCGRSMLHKGLVPVWREGSRAIVRINEGAYNDLHLVGLMQDGTWKQLYPVYTAMPE